MTAIHSPDASVAPVPSRVFQAVVAIFLQLVLGIMYSWSVLRGPLAQLYGWSEAQTIAPYRYSLFALTFGIIVAGFWQDRKGPRVVATASGLLLSAGCLVAALAHGRLSWLVVGYGLLGGFGVGCGYVPPIANLLRWFPERRGSIVGLAIMGVGFGPLLYSPLLAKMVGSDPLRFGVTVPRTFLFFTVYFFILVVGAAQFYKVPPPGWKPAGWTPPEGHVSASDMSPRAMLRTWQFYVIWLALFLGVSAGLTAIGQSTQTFREKVPASAALLAASTVLGLMGLGSGSGRLLWGAVSDRFGRRAALTMIGGVSCFACAGLLRGGQGFWSVTVGLFLAALTYGGYLAVLPALVADYFGTRSVGANYGLTYTAWGLCGFLVPGYFAGLIDHAIRAGNSAAGYRELYGTLAVFALASIILSLLLRPPRQRL